jgi:hypothetical protein
MPFVRTSPGRRPSAVEIRFCTSTAAMSTFRVTSNVTLIVQTPLFVLDDVM